MSTTNNTPVLEEIENQVQNEGLLMEALIKLYSNPIRASIQETISNARDANRTDNSKRKIEITAPTKSEMVFKVRDFGSGISPEKLKNVVSNWGTSTSRDNDKLSGHFGIGFKSVFAYTSKFEFDTVVDGMKRYYFGELKPKEKAKFCLVKEEKTDEPNGTTISIKLNKKDDLYSFQNSILRTIYFWEENETPILKNIELKKNRLMHTYGPLEIHNGLPNYISERYYSSDDIIVYDGIPYELESFNTKLSKMVSSIINKHRELYYNDHQYNNDPKMEKQILVYKAINGSLEPSSTRESIIEQENNKTTIDKLYDNSYQAIIKYIRKKMSDCKDLTEASKVAIELSSQFDTRYNFNEYSLSVEGQKDNNTVSIKNKNITGIDGTSRLNRNGRFVTEFKDISTISTINSPIFYQDNPDETIVNTKKRMRYFMDYHRKSIYVLTNVSKKIISDLNAKPISELSMPLPNRKKVVKQDICLHYMNGYSTYIHKQKNDSKQVLLNNILSPHLYLTMDNDLYRNKTQPEFQDRISYLKSRGYKICFIATSKEKLIKDHPQFTSYEKFISEYKLNDSDKKLIIKSDMKNNHPVFTNFINSIGEHYDKLCLDIYKYFNHLQFTENTHYHTPPKSLWGNFKESKMVKEYENNIKELKTVFEKYPLMSSIHMHLNTGTELSTKGQDVINYLNSKEENSIKLIKLGLK